MKGPITAIILLLITFVIGGLLMIAGGMAEHIHDEHAQTVSSSSTCTSLE